MKSTFVILFVLSAFLFCDGQTAAWYYNHTSGAPPSYQQPTIWLVAEDIDNDNNSGNNPVDGADVNTWADISGNGYDFTANGPTLIPVYRPNNLNGLAGVEFSNDGMSSASIPFFDNLQDYTVICVAKHTSSTTNYIFNLRTTERPYAILNWVQSGTNVSFYRTLESGATGSQVLNGAVSVNDPFIIQQNWESLNMYGTVRTSTLDSGPTTPITANLLSTHDSWNLGTFGPATGHLDGLIYEFMVFTPHLSAADETYWEDYLYSKYGF